MVYYLGKGTELKKEECKEYKTLEGALRAAAKDETLVVWDETGKCVGSLTDNVPDGALETNPDGSVNTYDADGNVTGTISGEELEKMTSGFDDDADASTDNADASTGDGNGEEQTNTPPATENDENEANNEPQAENNDAAGQQDNDVTVPQGRMKVTVICDTALNLRRSPAWGNENICGRAMRGQSYFVKAIHTVAGKKMVQTVDGIYLSGQSDHVQFEQL